MMKDFVYLHAHSAYSILQSGMTVEDYVLGLKKLGVSAAGLSDLDYFFGQPNFVKLSKNHQIRPLIGIDIKYADLILTFYPKNESGYRALIQMSKLALEQKLDDSIIKKYRELLILIISNQQEKLLVSAQQDTHEYRDIFKRFSLLVDDFFIGIESYQSDDADAIYTREFARKYNYDLVAFPLVKYVTESDAINVELAKAIRDGLQLGDLKTKNGPYHLYSILELSDIYQEDECLNTIKIAEKITFEFNQSRGTLLKFDTPINMGSADYLKSICELELKKKRLDDKVHRNRLLDELKIIDTMGYNDYFLIVSDFVKFAKNRDILVGPGRGSAAGSLVAFLLDITTIDPLEHGLLFERFLNPQRQTMPDIDIDFMDIRREEVITYLKEKYGTDKICNIITFQTNAARASIRDIGRIYEVDNRHINLLTKSLGNTLFDLRESYRKIKSFKTLVDSDVFYLDIVSLSSKIEGFPRQTGLHAAGLILNDEPLINVLPIYENNGLLISQFEMEFLENQGFLKMDLLGLTNLTTIARTLELIKTYKGVDLSYEAIPYDDNRVYDLISSGHTMGIFQLESGGMLRAIRQVKPSNFNDIVAILALFRPGPMENIPTYARRKETGAKVHYLNEKIEEILGPTYGIIVYQEQIMQIVREMAGFTYAEADLFRRAISKKDEKLLAKLENDFLDGATRNGYSFIDAKKTFDDIHKFADYGFNKSHSVAYAKLACQMAYLKAYYPLEFYAAILDRATSSDTKFPQIVTEMKEQSIQLLLPSVNESNVYFLPKTKELRLPLSVIKGVSQDKASRLISEREKNGPYTSLENFMTRMNFVELTKNDLRLLAEAGAMDEFGYSRNTVLAQIDNIDLYKNYSLDQASSFLSPMMIEEIKDNRQYRIQREIELIGLAISDNPLQYFEKVMKEKGFTSIATMNKVDPKIYGYIKQVKTIKTKRGDQMAFITLSDYESQIDLTLFPEVYAKHFQIIEINKIIAVRGTYQIREEKAQIIANEMTVFEEI